MAILVMLLALAAEPAPRSEPPAEIPMVRLGVFSQSGRAQVYSARALEELPTDNGRLSSRIIPTPWRGGWRYHVYLDGFSDAAEARNYCAYIASLGQDCLVETRPYGEPLVSAAAED